jgi:hypothetical protein
MRIVGEWLVCDDGVTRPSVRASVRDVDGALILERYLIDSGADRTVLSADLLRDLRLPIERPSLDFGLRGVSGGVSFVVVTTAIEFVSDDRRPATVRGGFAAFTDPRAMDMSILGRDVLDNFDVIISRRRNGVLLLAPNHQYHVTPA